MEPQLEYTKNVSLVDCHDLDKFVAIHLDGFDVTWRSLESTRWDGYHNGSYEEADVAPGQESDWDDGQDFGRWLTGGPYFGEETYGGAGGMPSIEEMLQWLCDQGKVPAGKYVVKLWW